MELHEASDCLASLGHETRLAIYRHLVQAGEAGLSAGVIGEQLGLAAATLSFHLAHLSRVGLISSRPDGRYIFYRADYVAMKALLGFLTENCCRGEPCGSTSSTESTSTPSISCCP